jgi:putative endonuclease
MTVPSTRDLGSTGERLAIKLLKKKGYKVLEKNFRSKFGEIDIVGLDKDTLVFIEVKTRWTREYGPPEEAVTPRKIRSIIKTGQYYKLLHPEQPEALRIDVVTIDFFKKNGETRLIKNVTS